MADNLDKVVESGIPLHKALAMGMAEGGAGPAAGKVGGATNDPAATVKEDIGMPETMPGMGSMASDKY